MQFKVICYKAEDNQWDTFNDIRNLDPACTQYYNNIDQAQAWKNSWESDGLYNYTYLADIYQSKDNGKTWEQIN